MSGHSKWSTIKHKKGKADAARGKVFTKIIREISTAAKQGGGDPDANPRLRLAIDKAKDANMPNDNIDRAIAKATGGGDGITLDEVTYEGYGPSGVAVLVEAMTDNTNRTVSEIKNLFTKNGGSMGAAGCVGWLFKKKGIISFDKKGLDVDTVSLAAIDAGAEDIADDETSLDIITTPDSLTKIRDALKGQGFTPTNAEVSMEPSTKVKISDLEVAKKLLKLMEVLEDNDDVQNVYANFDIPDQILEQAS